MVMYLWLTQMCHFPPCMRSWIFTCWYDNSRGFVPVNSSETFNSRRCGVSTSQTDRLLIILLQDITETGLLMGCLLIITQSYFWLPCWPKPIMVKIKFLHWNKITFTFMVDNLFILHPPSGTGGSSKYLLEYCLYDLESKTGWIKPKGEKMAPKCYFFAFWKCSGRKTYK